MYLWKPSKQEQSEPIDFYFHPKRSQFKQPATAQAPQIQKQAQKRNKVKSQDNSDSSSKCNQNY